MSKSDRVATLRRVVTLVGGQSAEIHDAANGWPALVDIHTASGSIPAALHVSPIQLTHRGRDDVERRFQNPGKRRPLRAPSGTTPLLIGLWEESPQQPILVAMDARRRIGRETRQSLFFPLRLLTDAARQGWSDHMSSSGERIFAFVPPLLPAYVQMVRDETVEHLVGDRMIDVVTASGVMGNDDPAVTERGRRASMALVRDAAFSRDVIRAYEGLCALCGLDFDLVQGAHILPVHAEGSADEVWNGLALCGNHHAAFDRHLIWIDPSSRVVAIRPTVQQNASRNESCRAFLTGTFARLAEPQHPALRPSEAMFRRRYDLYAGLYAWGPASRTPPTSTTRRKRRARRSE